MEFGPADLSPAFMSRFFDKVAIDPDGCWAWVGCLRNGYGRMRFPGWGTASVHRISWVWHTGQPLARTTQIDHLCRNPPCVRPDHLEPVTAAENYARSTGRGAAFARSRLDTGLCPAGHDLSLPYAVSFSRCRACLGTDPSVQSRDWVGPTEGEALRALRTANGLRLKDVAAATGVSLGFIAKIERGVNRTGRDTYDHLIAAVRGAQGDR